MNDLDVEILRFISRFQYVRSCHVAEWTGASGWTIRHRLRGMVDRGEIIGNRVGVDLRDPLSGEIRPSATQIWQATAAGGRVAGEWAVPGHQKPVSFPRGARAASYLTAANVLGMADLGVWYRRAGFNLISQREIISCERDFVLTPDRTPTRFWAAKLDRRTGLHVPSLGVAAPGGSLWVVELVQSQRTVAEYLEILRAFRNDGVGMVVHVRGKVASGRILTACKQAGYRWAEPPAPGVALSTDGMIRLQGYAPWTSVRPGEGPGRWPKMYRPMPAGFPEPAGGRPDLSALWRRENGL